MGVENIESHENKEFLSDTTAAKQLLGTMLLLQTSGNRCEEDI